MADYQDLAWPATPDPAVLCAHAEAFAAYCDALLKRLDQVKAADRETGFVQAKLLLVDAYADHLADLPVNHTNAAGRKKHRCLGDVLNETVKAIRERQRQALPPRLTKVDVHALLEAMVLPQQAAGILADYR